MERTIESTAGIDPHLETFRGQFADTRRAARELAARFTGEQMNWHPAPGSWSMADCIVHLCEAGELYVTSFANAISDARRRGLDGRGPFRHGLIGRIMIDQIEPPAKVKMRAPGVMARGVKLSHHDVDEVIGRFDRLGAALDELIVRADGLDLKRIKLPSVVTKLIRMNLAAWLQFLAAHERRHLWQARRVADAPGFPG